VYDRGRGDADNVSCGVEGVAAFRKDPIDHVAASCRLDALARSERKLAAHIRRLHRSALTRARRLRFTELRVPGPGVVSVLFQIFGRKSSVKLHARAAPRVAGRATLTFHVTARARAIARSRFSLIVILDFTPSGGRQRRYVIPASPR
jgi:hypothetical protein